MTLLVMSIVVDELMLCVRVNEKLPSAPKHDRVVMNAHQSIFDHFLLCRKHYDLSVLRMLILFSFHRSYPNSLLTRKIGFLGLENACGTNAPQGFVCVSVFLRVAKVVHDSRSERVSI